jgi:CTP:molybdopterin cytidylyltransferase MocA
VKDVAAILLAAGRSRRMGAFKPLLPFGEKSVIESCIDALRGAGVEEIVVVIGYRGEEIRAHLATSDVRFAVNPDIESEMSVSIARGIEQISSNAKALLITLVDHPAVRSESVGSIIAQWQHGARLVQPQYRGHGGHPVLVDLSFRKELLNLDAAGGLRSFFAAHRAEVKRLLVETAGVASDMDTWEDYVRLHQEVFGHPPKT